MNRALPTLDSRGSITDPTIIFDYMLATYCQAKKSGSTLNPDSTYSFAHTIYAHGNDPDMMASKVASDLNAMMQDYVDESKVRCTAGKADEQGKFTLIISGEVVNNGIRHALNQGVNRAGGITLKVA